MAAVVLRDAKQSHSASRLKSFDEFNFAACQNKMNEIKRRGRVCARAWKNHMSRADFVVVADGKKKTNG